MSSMYDKNLMLVEKETNKIVDNNIWAFTSGNEKIIAIFEDGTYKLFDFSDDYLDDIKFNKVSPNEQYDCKCLVKTTILDYDEDGNILQIGDILNTYEYVEPYYIEDMIKELFETNNECKKFENTDLLSMYDYLAKLISDMHLDTNVCAEDIRVLSVDINPFLENCLDIYLDIGDLDYSLSLDICVSTGEKPFSKLNDVRVEY